MDKIQVYGADSALVAMTKQEFFAQAEKRIRDSAGSGFSEWGKHFVNNATVNEGLWQHNTDAANANRLAMGFEESGSGISRSTNPIGVVSGVSLAINSINYAGERNYIQFPDAPDGTKTYDSATGVVTQHTSAAEAFEGLVTDGDFRSGGITNFTFNNSTGTFSNGTIQLVSTNASWASMTQSLGSQTQLEFKVEVVISRSDVDFDIRLDNIPIAAYPAGTTGVITVIGDSSQDTTLDFAVVSKSTASGAELHIESLSVMPVTEQVITSRKDFAFLEVFHEEVSLNAGVDGNKDEVYYKGMVQSGKTNPYGITSTTRSDGYTRFGEWDSVTTGHRVIWSTMNFIERNEFLQDPENNFYRDGDKIIQVRGRIRVIEGLGDDWKGIKTESHTTWFGYNVSGTANAIRQRGSSTSSGDFYVSGSDNGRLYVNQNYTDSSVNENGLWTPRNTPETTVAHDNQCFALPIALVQRRNQGGYHPAYNPNGCSKFIHSNGNDARDWTSTAIRVPPTSMSSCFGAEAHTGTGDIGSSNTGRIQDSKFYDAIYASDVDDLRMSSLIKTDEQIHAKYSPKAKAGDIRGYEGVPFTKWYVVGSTSVGTSSPNIVKLPLADITGQPFDANESQFPATGSVIVGGTVHAVSALSSDAVNLYIKSPTLPTGGVAGGSSVVAVIGEASSHKQANPTWTSLIGDPARILATFPNGVEGQWIPILPNGANTPKELNRKSLAVATAIAEHTLDDGLTWDKATPPIDSVTNEVTVNDPVNRVWLIHYETKAHFTEDALKAASTYEGDLFATNANTDFRGCILRSSLTGKISTGNNSKWQWQAPLTYLLLENSGSGSFIASGTKYEPEHAPVELNGNSGSAIKLFDKVVHEDGVANLHFHYKDMIYDTEINSGTDITFIDRSDTDTTLTVIGDYCHITSGTFQGYYRIVNDTSVAMSANLWSHDIEGNIIDANGGIYFELWNGNGWGDDDMFQIVNNQGSFTDDNGNVGVRGTAKLRRGAVQYFSTEM